MSDLTRDTSGVRAEVPPFPPGDVPHSRLVISGAEVPLTADYSLLFPMPAGKVTPCLYFRGRRVARPWRLQLVAQAEGDPDGGNANTA